MQFVLDHLVATLVAGTVTLLLAVLLVRNAEGTRDTTRFYGHQRSQAAVTSLIERDLTYAGIGTPAGATPVQQATADRFAFYGVVDDVGTTGLIEYREVAAGTLDGAPVVELERYVDGVKTGGAAGTLSRFVVTPLTDAGADASGALATARRVRVDAEWVLAHAERDGAERRQAARRSAWQTDIRPLAFSP